MLAIPSLYCNCWFLKPTLTFINSAVAKRNAMRSIYIYMYMHIYKLVILMFNPSLFVYS